MGEIILWTCITQGTLVIAFLIIYYIISAKNLKKHRELMRELQESIKIGKKVLFSGGLCGRITSIKDEFLEVEIAKDIRVTVSRYGITEVLK